MEEEHRIDEATRRAQEIVDTFNKDLTQYNREYGGVIALRPIGNIGVELIGVTFLMPPKQPTPGPDLHEVK